MAKFCIDSPSKNQHYFTVTVVKSSCTRVKRQCTSVIKVGVVYVAGAVDKWLQVISNTMLFKTVIPLRIKIIKLFK